VFLKQFGVLMQLIRCVLLLQANTDWSALAVDAAKRKRIVTVPSAGDAKRLVEDGCKLQQLPAIITANN